MQDSLDCTPAALVCSDSKCSTCHDVVKGRGPGTRLSRCSAFTPPAHTDAVVSRSAQQHHVRSSNTAEGMNDGFSRRELLNNDENIGTCCQPFTNVVFTKYRTKMADIYGYEFLTSYYINFNVTGHAEGSAEYSTGQPRRL